MSLPKPFEEYVKKRIVRKVTPDKSRAVFLIGESDSSLEGLNERLEKVGINEKKANSIIKDCYDIMLELIRARLLLEGYAAAGLGAHEAEISYMSKLGFSDREVDFLNEVRYYRNSVTYYGKILDKDYAGMVVKFLTDIHVRLHKAASSK